MYVRGSMGLQILPSLALLATHSEFETKYGRQVRCELRGHHVRCDGYPVLWRLVPALQ